MIKHPFDSGDLSGKEKCRRSLVARAGLIPADGAPVVGMISRLVAQKGLDLLADAIEEIMKLDVRFVLLGSGQDKYQKLCQEWVARWPGRFHATIGFDHKLAHRIEAGSDLFFMPSRFEPCGLSQFYALRYGTIPVVHATGGLNDSVAEMSADGTTGNGYRFAEYTVPALMAAIGRALELYRQREVWLTACRRVMLEDHSWSRSAAEYLDVYQSVLDVGLRK